MVLLLRTFLFFERKKSSGAKFAAKLYQLHQNKFSACKSADDCKQFFVPFVAVSQGFTEISAANRESLNWTSGSVF